MDMRDVDRALVQAAGAVARLRCRSDRHTVAAAVRTPEGRVFTGVNVRHATGDTCAEVVTLGTAVTQGATGLETIVAVGDRGREILPPCERCRRLLLDHHPRLRVIVGPPDDPRVLLLGDLPADPAPADLPESAGPGVLPAS
ncbi:cytidine deaminase [Micromonospora cathayae]|uniref:Cytidine deaminase n=1 Tax=Micromonospora cathayae TaxID=3028804 RepID=A0ABY7ZYA2_9ACTN|nr:cytidine deaminase [Micromonospora sp. HUAS 3]WDZ87883.1 cytidine deaminase [Micromonospora sp. HUAS 3]